MWRRNPILPRLDFSTLLLIGGGVYFWPKIKEMLDQAFPSRPPGGTTGDPSVPGSGVPSGTVFRLTAFSVDKPFSLLGYPPGTTLKLNWTLDHQGPADRFVAGARLRQPVPAGRYLSSEIEQSFDVQSEGSYGRYYVETTFVTTEWLPTFFTYDVWVRNLSGVHIVDRNY